MKRRNSWEMIGDAFYPYIEVPIDSKITTVVGANESGKSHLLSAIEKTVSGNDIERSDFCRYSPFFTVKQNELKYPDFGSEWAGLSNSEEKNIRKIIPGIHEEINFDRFLVFRNNITNLKVYIPNKGDYKIYNLGEKQAENLQKLLPKTFKIKSSVALPSSVPIKKLVELGQKDYSGSRKFEILDREQRNKIVDALDVFSDNPELITKVRAFYGEKREEIKPEAVEALKLIISEIEGNFSDKENKRREE